METPSRRTRRGGSKVADWLPGAASGYLATATVVLAAPPASASTRINARVRAERAEIATLSNGTTVLRGDTGAYDYLLAHPDHLVLAGLHPDATGAAVLARGWADALRPLVLASRCPASHARYSFQNSAIV